MERICSFIKYSLKTCGSLSIYLLSSDNLKRKRIDLDSVIDAEIYFCDILLAEMAKQMKIKVVHAGNKEILPLKFNSSINKIEKATKMYDSKKIYLLIGYDPFMEVNASNNGNNVIDINKLWVPEYVDLIIRTAGGPVLMSNFLPLQSGYAQFYIIDKYFNDFNEDDFGKIIEKAKKIKMLHGK